MPYRREAGQHTRIGSVQAHLNGAICLTPYLQRQDIEGLLQIGRVGERGRAWMKESKW